MRHLKSALDVEDMWTGKSSGCRSPAYYTCVISQLIPLRAGLFMKSLNTKNGESTFFVLYQGLFFTSFIAKL